MFQEFAKPKKNQEIIKKKTLQNFATYQALSPYTF